MGDTNWITFSFRYKLVWVFEIVVLYTNLVEQIVPICAWLLLPLIMVILFACLLIRLHTLLHCSLNSLYKTTIYFLESEASYGLDFNGSIYPLSRVHRTTTLAPNFHIKNGGFLNNGTRNDHRVHCFKNNKTSAAMMVKMSNLLVNSTLRRSKYEIPAQKWRRRQFLQMAAGPPPGRWFVFC